MKMERPEMKNQDVYNWIEQLRDTSYPQGRIRAIQALEDLDDPRAVTALIDGLRDNQPEIREHAAKAFVKLRSVRAVDALIERLNDPDERGITRRFAAESLGKIQGARAMEALARFQTNQDPGTQGTSERSGSVLHGD
jgi:HEAT repeat protein